MLRFGLAAPLSEFPGSRGSRGTKTGAFANPSNDVIPVVRSGGNPFGTGPGCDMTCEIQSGSDVGAIVLTESFPIIRSVV